MAATKIPEGSKLLQPIKIGSAQLQQRIALAPLSRYRNDNNNVVMPIAQRYYSERASAPGTLVISEATDISLEENGSRHNAGFYTAEQVAAWKLVIEAVHANGGVWFQQLRAQGRASNPEYLKKRGVFKYRSSSAVPLTPGDLTPTEMTEEEILQVIGDFVAAAKRVVDAGGDGIEIHGAQGFLLDQFISDAINKRTDRWGGSVENRSRLTLEIVKAVSAAIGPECVALRLSPYNEYNGTIVSNVAEQYSYIARELKRIGKLAYISLVEARGDPMKLMDPNPDPKISLKTLDFFLDTWGNQSPIVLAGGYTGESAIAAVDKHYAKWDVIVAFGRHFLSNPDLIWRLKNGVALNPYHRPTFYLGAIDIGYNDYPFSTEYIAERRAWAVANVAPAFP
jgi:NADPH2 dehydrogenase